MLLCNKIFILSNENIQQDPKGGCALIKILSENLKIILVGMVSVLMIIAVAILISLYFGGNMTRRLVVTEIKGSAYLTRNGKRYNADKNIVIQSGDVISTDSDAYMRIRIDDDKYVYIEPESSLYIYFTDIASKGDISVNLTGGAVICEINKEPEKNSSFTLKTPNCSASVRDTVFRTEFEYHESYKGYNNVMITEVQNLKGSMELQLYDSSQQATDLPRLLVERNCAQLITSDELCQYGYVNYGIDLSAYDEITLREILRAENENGLAFSADEVNAAYINSVNKAQHPEGSVSNIPTESTSAPLTEYSPPETEESSTSPEPVETTVPPPENEPDEYYGTTKQTYVYTTYTGIKWWELTGNQTSGYENNDIIEDDQDEYQMPETVTAVTSAEQ